LCKFLPVSNQAFLSINHLIIASYQYPFTDVKGYFLVKENHHPVVVFFNQKAPTVSI